MRGHLGHDACSSCFSGQAQTRAFASKRTWRHFLRLGRRNLCSCSYSYSCSSPCAPSWASIYRRSLRLARLAIGRLGAVRINIAQYNECEHVAYARAYQGRLNWSFRAGASLVEPSFFSRSKKTEWSAAIYFAFINFAESLAACDTAPYLKPHSGNLTSRKKEGCLWLHVISRL